MLGQTHQVTTLLCAEIAALGVTQIAAPHFTPLTAGLTLSGLYGAWWGSLLPDIDEPKSLINQTLGPVGRVISHWLSHRGITHTLLAWLTVTVLPCWCLRSWITGNWWQQCGMAILLGLSFGYFCHLLEDSWSVAGVHWLYPLTPTKEKQHRKQRWHYHTGGQTERLWHVMAVIGVIVTGILLGGRWL